MNAQGLLIEPGRELGRRYRADLPIGRGGMGEVWRCRDLDQDRDVAVKVLRRELTSEEWAERLFRDEVLAMARLAHPVCIPIYDVGHEPGVGAFLVMEYRGGTFPLSRLRTHPPPWPLLWGLADELLDGLGYAHSKGVLHLDIKPGNILFGWEARRLRATLLDFGIARVRRPGRGIDWWSARSGVAGTVPYVAPEQCTGQIWKIGRPTDLFSLGVVFYEIVAGFRPFDADDMEALTWEHRLAPAPLVPRAEYGNEVPAAFCALVDQMLQIEPERRPRFAADLRTALRGMLPAAPATLVETASAVRGMAPPPPPPRWQPADAAVPSPQSALTVLERPCDVPTTPQIGRAWLDTPATAPSATQVRTRRAADLSAGSYGLCGLRELPLIGRSGQRRTAWRAVRDALVTRRPRLVLLEGGAGVGKTRLAHDMMEHGEQLGLLEGIQASWSERPSADEGLRALVENTLDCREEDDAGIRQRLALWLAGIQGDHADFVDDVLAMLRPHEGVELDPGLSLRVALALVEGAAARRPVLLLLDDLQWGVEEAWPLLEKVLHHPRPLPVCVVATIRTDEPLPAAYEALCATERAIRVPMPPLDPATTRRLVHGLLDVDAELGGLLGQRAEGNPLFATQLVQQLVEENAVERRAGRYALARGFDLEQVPRTIGALWEKRIARAFPDERQRQALRALALARQSLSPALVDALGQAAGDPALYGAALHTALSAGFCRRERRASRWTHGLLRDHLVQAIPEDERAGAHRVAAAALDALRAHGEEVDYERAQHLRAGGLPDQAEDALLESAKASRNRGRLAEGRARYQELLGWLDERAPAPDVEERRAWAQAELGHEEIMRGSLEEAETHLRAAEAAAKRSGKREPMAHVLNRVGRLRYARGDLAGSVAAHRAAARLAKELALHRTHADALITLAHILDNTASLAEARAAAEKGLAIARAAGDVRRQAQALHGLALAELAEGRIGEAKACVDAALGRFRQAGDAHGEAVVLDTKAEVLSQSGEVARARRCRERYVARMERAGLVYHATIGRMNLAEMYCAVDDLEGAEAQLRVMDRNVASTDSVFRVLHPYLVAEVAAQRHPAQAEDLLRAAVHAQQQGGVLHRMIAESTERVGARTRGRLRRAFLSEAARLWDALGRSADAARVRAHLRDADEATPPTPQAA
jgi:serine/threonine protein kinase/tetratricopeptide (TPR) repeat protein